MTGMSMLGTAPKKLHPFSLFGITDLQKYPTGCRNICDPSLALTLNRFELKDRKPFFSVVMTGNRLDKQMLGSALWSLSQQTLLDFELVFVCTHMNDMDYAAEFCLDRDISIVGCCEPTSRSRSERFKIGVEAARGEWIVILDSDDILHPDALWTVYRCLKRFPIINFFSGSHKVFDMVTNGRGSNPAMPLAQTVNSLMHTFKQRHFWGFINDPSRWPPRMLETQYPVEDYWLFSVLATNACPVLHVPHYLYAWRSHPAQWSKFHRNECEAMSDSIQRYLRGWSKRQSAMWHWGDMALSVRLNDAMIKLEKEIELGGDS